MVGAAAGDGVADIVEAGLSHSSQSPPSFHLIQLSSPQLVQSALQIVCVKKFFARLTDIAETDVA